MTRRLALRREALAELTCGDLSRVVGAQDVPLTRTFQVDECLFAPTWNPGACGGPPGSMDRCAG